MDNQSTDKFLIGDEKEIVGFAWGAEEIDPEDANCLAKKIENKSRETTQYFVKMFRGNSGVRGFVNPIDPMFTPSMLTKQHSHLGCAGAEFTKVSRQAFDLYLTFLRTKNSVFCRQAERCD